MFLQQIKDILTDSKTHDPDLTHEQEQAVNDLFNAMDRIEEHGDILIDSYPQLTHSGEGYEYHAITRETLDKGDTDE